MHIDPHNLIIVLNDGETFSNATGCLLVSVPENVESTDEIEDFLKEGNYPHLTFGQPMSQSVETMRELRAWMSALMPEASVELDNDGQIVIYTGEYVEGSDEE